MPNFSISAKAYAKIVLHCCKYPHRAVNGVVIGTFSDKDQGAAVLIQDAVPLFHQNLSLAPMLEVALRQVDVYSEKKGLVIVGYYHANQRLDDNSPSEAAQLIAGKIASNVKSSNKACLLMVDNQSVGKKDQLCLKLMTRVESENRWKDHRDFSLVGSAQAQERVHSLILSRAFEKLVTLTTTWTT
ncbi:ER membrane protein complex subunit 9 [Geodia barretti]|uniref:ER membrane protein complex subunit 9 n=1 Tax=Geodia barretti TaxID=519541 RepID=A0AA35WPR0_GEOBA|nr:ER membrane protein complex subunit 9 [Geodia barretti]